MATVLNDQPIRSLFADALSTRVFPGGVLLVDVGGRIAFFDAFGRTSTAHASAAVTTDTVFDLASLTKPLVTAALVCSLAAERR
ncbi:MAG TPA: serine hydrolase, partial [Nitrospiria bacterium]|nr:serine hydrolase [Nitrospiria bacterium]